jgi:hypothetical protein
VYDFASVRESKLCTAKMGAKHIQGRALSKLEETQENAQCLATPQCLSPDVRQTYISLVDTDHEHSRGIETPVP